jgi:hypothetical protein
MRAEAAGERRERASASAPTCHDAGMPSSGREVSGRGAGDLPGRERDGAPPGAGDPLAGAYEQRTKQLYDARAALAEAVSALTVELGQRREESTALRDERDRALLDSRALREHAAALEGELRTARELAAALRNMKVVRWTTWPRRIVYRLRARRG